MTPQQHADHLLAVWQQRRDLPPEKRLPPETKPINFPTTAERGERERNVA
ncbi:hypothetical protein CRBSH125_09930 [Afipia carboxidovorans]|nr:hypothetical protein CRBSH125_09930 [Afipia carboxidovorans]